MTKNNKKSCWFYSKTICQATHHLNECDSIEYEICGFGIEMRKQLDETKSLRLYDEVEWVYEEPEEQKFKVLSKEDLARYLGSLLC